MTNKMKLEILKPHNGLDKGDVIEVENNREWRSRLKDAKVDGFIKPCSDKKRITADLTRGKLALRDKNLKPKLTTK